MIRQNALVAFEGEHPLAIAKNTYVFLGEIPQAPGHCVLADVNTGKVECMYHTDSLRELTDEEV